MSFYPQNKDEGSLREAVEPVLRVLSQLGGHFTFTDQQGEQFVIARKADFDASRRDLSLEEKQLPLTTPSVSRPSFLEEGVPEDDEEDEIVEYVNRDIALTVPARDEDIVHEILLTTTESSPEEGETEEPSYETPLPPPVRVRFEPIKGDLPPGL